MEDKKKKKMTSEKIKEKTHFNWHLTETRAKGTSESRSRV